jgi:hypothetical protein
MSQGNLSIPSTKMVFLLALMIFTLVVACKTQEVQTRWSPGPVKVDGEMDEWASGSTVYFEDLGVQLGLSNDSQNLYVLFRFSNHAWARAIRMGGLTLWLDNSGKKKKDLGISYTGGPSMLDLPMQGSSSRGGFREAMTPEMQQRLAEMEQNPAGQITLIHKKGSQEITLRPDGSGGPAAGFASPRGIYTYEFSIPLEKGDVFDCAIGAEPGQTISLGFEWGGMSKEDRQKMMERMGGGMGSPPPGSMSGGRGGMGGRPGGPRMRSAEKQELWVKTQLALPTEG